MFWIAMVILLVAALLAYAASRPDQFRVERRARINATPDKVFPLLNDFRRWSIWSPWERLDPNLTRRHSGPDSGQGAVYEWEGNSNVGTGRMEITSASAPSQVTIKLDFIQPFQAHNVAEFALQRSGDATHVTWAMHGPNPFMARLMSAFLDMDQMVGKDFETGLANLKTITEKQGSGPTTAWRRRTRAVTMTNPATLSLGISTV